MGVLWERGKFCLCAALAISAALPAIAAGQEQSPPTLKPPYSGKCAVPRILADLGETEAAKAAYIKLLGKANCAPKQLETLVQANQPEAAKPEPTRRQKADELRSDILRLRAAGFDDKADELLQTFATDTKAEVRDYLKKDDPGPGWWNSLLGWLEEHEWIGVAVALLLGVAALVLILLRLFRELRLRTKRRLEIVVKGADEEGTVGLQAAIVQGLHQLAESSGREPVRMVRATDPQFEALPPSITDAYAPASAIAQGVKLLGRLIPSRTRTVTITARPADPASGVCVSAEMHSRWKDLSSQTFYESEFGLVPADASAETAGRLQRLALPIAVWIAYEYAAKVEGMEDMTVVGTLRWRSYAQFAVGAAAQSHGEFPLARAAYTRALDIDPNNYGAKLNLATTLMGPKQGNAHHDDDLELAISMLEEVGGD